MSTPHYDVELVINAGQPSLAYWTYDTEDEARMMFDSLKGGMTAHFITIHLTGPDNEDLECYRLGDEYNQAKSVKGKVVDYPQHISPSDVRSMTTGNVDDMLIID
jgi:hypothetical protein